MNCCCQKKKPRDEEFVKNLKSRLNRIQGQIGGVTKMLDENRYCSDILVQVAAIESALKEVGYMILKDHMHSCVIDDVKKDDYTSLDELIEIAKKLK